MLFTSGKTYFKFNDAHFVFMPHFYFQKQNDSASPAPKANEYLAKEKFYTEMAIAKIAAALGVKVHAIVERFSLLYEPQF